ncbi:MAG: sulfatase-like hydrolase/transferase [Candidatus Spyradosoma sp.]
MLTIPNLSFCATALAIAPFVVSAAEVAVAESIPAAGSKPNVIFILVDDMGWGDLNANWRYGSTFNNRTRNADNSYATPGLDAMAADGMLLLRHYTAAPVSVAARACLLTGMHTGHTRNVRDNCFDHPIANVHTLGSVMRDAGYATAVIGKWGIGGGGQSELSETALPRARGFDYFFGQNAHLGGHFHYPALNTGSATTAIYENDEVIQNQYSGVSKNPLEKVVAYSTDLYTARAKKWIADNDPAATGKPFFLLLTYTAPHGSLRVPPCSYPSGGGKNGGIQWVETTAEGVTVQTCNTSTEALATAAGATWAGLDGYIHEENAGFANDAARRHSTMVRRVSDAVADIRQLLADMNIAEDTLIVFTSDNGPHNEQGSDAAQGIYASSSPAQDPSFFKTYGMMDGIKRSCFDGGMREPAIVCWPKKIAPGSTSTHASQFQDWLATLSDLANAEVPASSSGVSLLPDLTGEGTQADCDIWVDYSGTNPAGYSDWIAAHKNATNTNQLILYVKGEDGKDYKGFVRGLTAGTVFSELDFEIYDTLDDPQETTNLAGTETDAANGITEKLRKKALRTRREPDGTADAGTRAYFTATANAVPPDAPRSDVKARLNFEIFAPEKAFPWVPDFRQTHLKAKTSGTARLESAGMLMPAEAGATAGPVGVTLEGFITVPTTGEYVFYLKTDANEGSKAFAKLHGVMPLIDADNCYTAGAEASSYMNVGTERASGTRKILLAAGTHPFRLEYVAASGTAGASLEMKWLLPGADEATAIPADAFSVGSDFGVNTREISTFSAGGKYVLEVTKSSGTTWSASTDSGGWIEISPEENLNSAATSGKLRISVANNPAGARREGTITLVCTDGAEQTITVSQEVAENYSGWKTYAFGEEAESDAAAPDESFSGDEVPNVLKYALGLDAKKKYGDLGEASIEKDAEDSEDEFLRVTYPKNTLAEDVEFFGELWDENTGAWTNGADAVEIIEDADAGTISVRSRIPAAGSVRQFLRLNVRLTTY